MPLLNTLSLKLSKCPILRLATLVTFLMVLEMLLFHCPDERMLRPQYRLRQSPIDGPVHILRQIVQAGVREVVFTSFILFCAKWIHMVLMNDHPRYRKVFRVPLSIDSRSQSNLMYDKYQESMPHM
ncbi:hypothetical protein C8J56DRAFT_478880 [Mycena floridula]|nr:hypothetical protein C8J56DRAFT_478880 [Mycena floridula]